MKKLLCMTLTLLLLCSLLPVPGVSAAEDLVPLFDDAINRLRWQELAWDVPQGEAFPVKTVMGYTKQLLCISGEFLTDTKRQHNDNRPLLMFLNQSAPFQLLHSLTKTESFK